MLLNHVLPDQRHIFTKLKAVNLKNLIEEISDKIATVCDLSADMVAEAFSLYGKLESTGIGKGVAIPYANFANLDKITGFFFHLETPMHMDAHDNLPIDLIFVLLVPERSGNEHLKVLAKLSRLFKSHALLENLRYTVDKTQIHALIMNNDIQKVA